MSGTIAEGIWQYMNITDKFFRNEFGQLKIVRSVQTKDGLHPSGTTKYWDKITIFTKQT